MGSEVGRDEGTAVLGALVGQAIQWSCLSWSVPYPSGHASHFVAPSLAWKKLMGHSEHLLIATSAVKVPLGQIPQEVAPGFPDSNVTYVPSYLPAGQAVQLAWRALLL